MTEIKKFRIGLVLGSGGSRGLSHIGVIKVLEENNIPIDFIVGSSIGAMVGGFYAAGIDTKKMEEIVIETDWKRLFSLVDPNLRQGLISGEKVKTFIQSYVDKKKIEDCKIPFVAVATDLKTGDIVLLDKGEMAQAIRASISIPLVFKPIEIDGKMLADGGLSSPVPVEVARKMGADLVIAVNLDKRYYDEKSWSSGWYDTAYSSLNILRHHLALSNVASADIVININVGKDNSWYQFVNGKDKILVGERATQEMLPQLKKLIWQKNGDNSDKYVKFLDK